MYIYLFNLFSIFFSRTWATVAWWTPGPRGWATSLSCPTSSSRSTAPWTSYSTASVTNTSGLSHRRSSRCGSSGHSPSAESLSASRASPSPTRRRSRPQNYEKPTSCSTASATNTSGSSHRRSSRCSSSSTESCQPRECHLLQQGDGPDNGTT